MMKRPVFVGVSESGGRDSLPPSQLLQVLQKPLERQYFQVLPGKNGDTFPQILPLLNPFITAHRFH
jgi:hypothetical protein